MNVWYLQEIGPKIGGTGGGNALRKSHRQQNSGYQVSLNPFDLLFDADSEALHLPLHLLFHYMYPMLIKGLLACMEAEAIVKASLLVLFVRWCFSVSLPVLAEV